MTKQNRIKNIKNHIREIAKNKSIDLEKVTEGKSIEQLAHSNITYKNFMKRKARQIQQPKLKEEVKKINEKIIERVEEQKKKKQMSYNRNKVVGKAQNLMRDSDIKPSKQGLKFKTQIMAHDFFYSYFKELSLNNTERKRIDKLVNRFGRRLDLLNDFMNDKEALIFRYPMPKELMKHGYGEEYEKHMKERLNSMENLLETKYFI